MDISIIIPNHNGGGFIAQAIKSSLQQQGPALEVIVVDDGSTDDSLSIIDQFGERVQLIRQKNQGAPKARNAGLSACQGKYIKFLDADDVLLPGSLARQVALAERLEDKAIVYGDVQWINEAGEEIRGFHPRPIQEGEDAVTHILTNCPLTSAPLHRRDYLLEIDGFDESVIKGQEHDLHLRLVLAGVRFVHHPGAVYQYREYKSTNRISSKKADPAKALAHYATLEKQERLITQYLRENMTNEVKLILADRYWQYGRMVLRQGFQKAALNYFVKSKALGGSNFVSGNILYRGMASLVGPFWTEKLLSLIKAYRLESH